MLMRGGPSLDAPVGVVLPLGRDVPDDLESFGDAG
jgi:hypothetical protein